MIRGGIIPKLRELYAHRCKDQYHAHREIKLSFNDDLTRVIDRIIEQLHNGTLLPGDVDEELYQLTAAELFAAVERGYGVTLEQATGTDLETLTRLRENVYIFSGFKTYQQLRAATDLLTDENGLIRSFADFRTEVLKLSQEYNINFLKAEYNHAVAGSQMAAKWQKIQQDADSLPLIQYITAGDSRVRQSHQVLDKIIRPVNDAFWDTYLPPNDWGCRCTVRQLAEGEITRADKLQDLPQLKDMFQINSGKNGVVFPSTHPYYQVATADKARARNNFGLQIPGTDD